MITRQDVYKAIDRERGVQDFRYPRAPPLPPGDELRLVRCLAAQADLTWRETKDAIVNGARVSSSDLEALRKIAAVCVRAMEMWGVPEESSGSLSQSSYFRSSRHRTAGSISSWTGVAVARAA